MTFPGHWYHRVQKQGAGSALNTFRDALRQKDFVISVELPLRPDTTATQIAAATTELRPVVDAVQILDDREAVGQMSALAAAALVRQEDVDPVIHLTARDRNRVALQAEILGAAALGVTSIVVSRGEKLSRKEFLRGKGVFDTSEARFIGMAKRISEETDLVSPPGFMIGTYVTVFDPDESWEAARISESLDTGVSVLYSQPCLNERLLTVYMSKLIEKKILHRASVIVEVPLLGSRDAARDYKKKNPIALIPDAVIKRIVEAEDAQAEGLAVCVEMLRALPAIPGVSGANIRHKGDATAVTQAVEMAGLSLQAVSGTA